MRNDGFVKYIIPKIYKNLKDRGEREPLGGGEE